MMLQLPFEQFYKIDNMPPLNEKVPLASASFRLTTSPFFVL